MFINFIKCGLQNDFNTFLVFLKITIHKFCRIVPPVSQFYRIVPSLIQFIELLLLLPSFMEIDCSLCSQVPPNCSFHSHLLRIVRNILKRFNKLFLLFHNLIESFIPIPILVEMFRLSHNYCGIVPSVPQFPFHFFLCSQFLSKCSFCSQISWNCSLCSQTSWNCSLCPQYR